jgi:protein-glucosylgalactosylhydroxylysine glucosidase
MSPFSIQIAFFLSFNLCGLLLFGNHHADINGSGLINRRALVTRHIPTLAKADTLSPFTVGNGEFAFTTDITGLQTFAGLYENGIPLGTQSQWGWHTNSNPNSYSLDQTLEYHDSHGRPVAYAAKQNSEAGQWLRSNPHRLHLGSIGFRIIKSDGSEIRLSDVTDIHQSADIWEGILKSSFRIENDGVQVETGCHPTIDQVGVRIRSTLLQKRNVDIRFDFPYGSTSWGKSSADWNSPHKHSSEIIFQSDRSATIERTLDTVRYYVNIQWNGAAQLKRVGRHSFLLVISQGNRFDFTCNFSEKRNTQQLPDASETLNACRLHWQNFWETGGAVDLSESTDPRAFELERRIVLSRYLTAIQCAGSTPPQETGLTFNSWYGKFHLEMHWWHAVHFVLWGHPELLERSLAWYKTILPMAAQTAKRQGYDGVRWPKMVGSDGRESPSNVGVFLIWQQPHPIYYSELVYRCRKDPSTLEKYKDIVFATADFMASYAQWDDRNSRYVLGPPLIPAQETYKPDSTMNPAFELSYWTYGLKLAQRWRERLGLPRIDKWDHVIQHLSKLPAKNGVYFNVETALNTIENRLDRSDHPTVLGAYGMLPNDSIDVGKMRKTLEKVLSSWNWERTWGWDYPLIAMTAARVGRPELAIKALLMDVQKNTYLNNGHNFQDERLPIYLPGNGALLTAVAMMAAGWDGAPDDHAPGFPKDGKWVVRYEGLMPLL